MSDSYAPPTDPIPVLHLDEHLLVVDKPQGLLSVPGKGAHLADCLLTRLEASHPGTLLVHRLDRDTSGVMIFARTKHSQRHLGLQFERRHTSKTYVALVSGRPSGDSGSITLPLVADWPNRPKQMVDFERGKPAVTHWRVLGSEEDTSRMELVPETGRSHQLRVHMAELGHPILGDPLYAEGPARGAERMMLHASELSIRNPDGGAPMTFRAEVPF